MSDFTPVGFGELDDLGFMIPGAQQTGTGPTGPLPVTKLETMLADTKAAYTNANTMVAKFIKFKDFKAAKKWYLFMYRLAGQLMVLSILANVSADEWQKKIKVIEEKLINE